VCCKLGVLHRDISFGNILLACLPNSSLDKVQQGLLIDFDYAASMNLPTEKVQIRQHTMRASIIAIY
jgi:serine/threonine protein kinase